MTKLSAEKKSLYKISPLDVAVSPSFIDLTKNVVFITLGRAMQKKSQHKSSESQHKTEENITQKSPKRNHFWKASSNKTSNKYFINSTIDIFILPNCFASLFI